MQTAPVKCVQMGLFSSSSAFSKRLLMVEDEGGCTLVRFTALMHFCSWKYCFYHVIIGSLLLHGLSLLFISF